ncbi:hypothetical protein LCGC14_2461020 [marine sediment metagenome]|uniref:Uncharacterized protein n=1 Tax=marine sediment metagenome TaxID=412755 RepID=A0A0F9BD87_9ZZZZ
MKLKFAVECDDCKKRSRHTEFIKGKNLCWSCAKKHKTMIEGSIPNYGEAASVQLTIWMQLTPTQRNLMYKRMSELYPLDGVKRRHPSKYLKDLLLADTKYWEIMNARNNIPDENPETIKEEESDDSGNVSWEATEESEEEASVSRE